MGAVDALLGQLDQAVHLRPVRHAGHQGLVEARCQDLRFVVQKTAQDLPDRRIDHLGAQELDPLLAATDPRQPRVLATTQRSHEQIQGLFVAEITEPKAVLDVDHAIADIVGGLHQEGQRMAVPDGPEGISSRETDGLGHLCEQLPVLGGETLLARAHAVEPAAA